MRVVGIDPGFASLGVVIAEHPIGIDDVVFTKAGCMKTTKCSDLSEAQDLTARADDLAADLAYFVEEGVAPDVFAVCVEGMSYPRFTQAAVKLGASHGVVGALISRWVPEVIYVEQPQRVRKNVMGVAKGRAPKEESVHEYLRFRYPELDALLEDQTKGSTPHILDAAACVVSALRVGRL